MSVRYVNQGATQRLLSPHHHQLITRVTAHIDVVPVEVPAQGGSDPAVSNGAWKWTRHS